VPEFKRGVQACGKCGAPVDLFIEERGSAQGVISRRLVHWFRCRRGCSGYGAVMH